MTTNPTYTRSALPAARPPSDDAPVNVAAANPAAVRCIDRGGIVRGLAAAGVLLSADIHLDLWYDDGFRDIATIGPLFLLNAVGGLIIGVAILMWQHWLPALAAAGFGATTLLFFYLSISPGLFGLHETAGGQAQVLAEVAEYVALVFGAVAAVYEWRRRRRTVRRPGAA